jgi:hypothetical protein
MSGIVSESRVGFPGGALVRCIAGVAIAYFAGGCATLTLTTLGTIVGSVATPVQGVLSAGKAHTAELADFGSAGVAVRQTADDLGMHFEPTPIERQTLDPTVLELIFIDDKHNRLKVTLDQRAPNLAVIQISVGFFGSEPVAHLFLDRLRKRLAARRPGAATGEDRPGSGPHAGGQVTELSNDALTQDSDM